MLVWRGELQFNLSDGISKLHLEHLDIDAAADDMSKTIDSRSHHQTHRFDASSDPGDMSTSSDSGYETEVEKQTHNQSFKDGSFRKMEANE